VDESQFWHESEVLAAVSSYDAAATDSQDQQPQDLHASLTVLEPEQSLFSKCWNAYSSALKTHPILVKSATSFVGFLIGDTVAQTIVGHGFDHFRTVRLVLFGMFMDGPVGKLPMGHCIPLRRSVSQERFVNLDLSGLPASRGFLSYPCFCGRCPERGFLYCMQHAFIRLQLLSSAAFKDCLRKALL
jgi:hypothetical protein